MLPIYYSSDTAQHTVGFQFQLYKQVGQIQQDIRIKEGKQMDRDTNGCGVATVCDSSSLKGSAAKLLYMHENGALLSQIQGVAGMKHLASSYLQMVVGQMTVVCCGLC